MFGGFKKHLYICLIYLLRLKRDGVSLPKEMLSKLPPGYLINKFLLKDYEYK